jgi:hypothetical protein
VLTHRTQSPLPSPEPVDLFVEYARIDDEHPIWVARSLSSSVRRFVCEFSERSPSFRLAC